MATTIVSLLLLMSLRCRDVPAAKIPVIHSTDLFHPHDDPDDHYNLACLFAMPEFDIQGIVLDMGATQAVRTGAPAVEQMIRVTGRRVPYAIGLSQRLRTLDDRALEEPAKFQGAVQLILSILRKSPEPVTIFTAGSCRDVAAAFNREPELLKRKVKAVYCNIGRGPNESQNECNVGYDPLAFYRLFESDLPIYWCPCFGKDGYQTFYTADQATVVGGCTPAVQNYFAYCLSRSPADPIAFLNSGPYPLPKGERRMWCTAPMFHAAGRKIYHRGKDDFVAPLPQPRPSRRGLPINSWTRFTSFPYEQNSVMRPCRQALNRRHRLSSLASATRNSTSICIQASPTASYSAASTRVTNRSLRPA